MNEFERTTWERYRAAVADVQWQVQLGETRAGRLMGFTALLLAAGLAAYNHYGWLFFALGAFSALLSTVAMHTDHGYYRAARTIMLALADEVDLLAGKPVTVRATPGQGGEKKRVISVQWAQRFIMLAMILIGVVGVVVAW
jgi:hypothetical protein